MSGYEDIEYSEHGDYCDLVPGEVYGEIFHPVETSEQYEDLSESGEGIIGAPEEDIKYWHEQDHPMSCAVACQEFVAEALLKEDFSETKMRAFAENREWFSDTGTPADDAGKLLEAMGLDVMREYGGSINDIAQTLSDGGKVMVSVNNMALEYPSFATVPGISANHMVEVIGIDLKNGDNIQMILNDSGVENGAGRRVPLETFKAAWDTGGCFMMSVYRKRGTYEN